MIYKGYKLKLSLLLFVMNVCYAFLAAQEGQVKIEYFPVTIENQNKHILESMDKLIKMDMEVRKIQSLNNDYQSKIQSKSVLEMQRYNEPKIHTYPLIDQNTISIYGANTNYSMPGISSGSSATLGLMLKPLNSWTVDVSGTILRYNDLLGYYHDFIINVSSNITLYDNLNLHLYGGYSTNGSNNTVKDYIAKSPFAANTHYGVGIGYKFSNSFKIEAGFKSEYNFWLKRWEEQGYISGKITF